MNGSPEGQGTPPRPPGTTGTPVVSDDSAASAGSESQAEGQAAMDTAEDAVIDES
jgi:hypothetical protein